MKRNQILLSWLSVNLVGWMIGLYWISFHTGQVAKALNINNDFSSLPDALLQMLLMVILPLGLALGILQSTQMGRWKVNGWAWIAATAIGLIAPIWALSRIRWYLLMNTDPMGDAFVTYLERLWVIYPDILLVTGLWTGALQALVMGKAMSRPVLWVLANALGLPLFGWVAALIVNIPLSKNNFEFLAQPNSYLIPPRYWWSLIVLLLPLVAALLTALPTGWVLARFGKLPEQTDAGAPPPAAGKQEPGTQ